MKASIRTYDIKNSFFKKFIKDNYKIFDSGCGLGNAAKPIKILFLAIILTFIKPSYLFFSFYFILIFIKSLIIGKRKSNSLFSQYFYFITRDLMNLFGFFFFYPKEVKKIDYSLIK